MPFPRAVKEQAAVACNRCCCICHEFKGTKLEFHHIKQEADGGENTYENCIPLCFDCHADMGGINPKHPKGNAYSEKELRMHRDKWYEQCSTKEIKIVETIEADVHALFKNKTLATDIGNGAENQKRYLSTGNSGRFTFDYSNNDGKYVIGTGEYEFATRWSKANDRSIHAYKDYLGVDGAIARVKMPKDWPVTIDESCDFSSRTRTPNVGDVIIWKNASGKYAATRILNIKDDTRGAEYDELTCEYVIYYNEPQNNTAGVTIRNAAGGHTVIIDDEKYIAERVIEEHNREIESLLKEI